MKHSHPKGKWHLKCVTFDKKIAPHLKRQEKYHETKLYDVLTKIYLKIFNLYMRPFSMDLVNCVLFEVSRDATRKCATFEASGEAKRKMRYI